ncbi:hypothetical protein RYX36_026818 [Vicia faba]
MELGPEIVGNSFGGIQTVFENSLMEHRVALHPDAMGKVTYVASAAQYSLKRVLDALSPQYLVGLVPYPKLLVVEKQSLVNLFLRMVHLNSDVDLFPLKRFTWLMEFSMDHDWRAVVKKLLNILLAETVPCDNAKEIIREAR